MAVGALAGYNEAVALLCFIAVPITVATWDKRRHCEGRFGSRPYSREDEPGLYWFAKATGVWSAIALLYGAFIAYDLIFRDGSLTGLGPP